MIPLCVHGFRNKAFLVRRTHGDKLHPDILTFQLCGRYLRPQCTLPPSRPSKLAVFSATVLEFLVVRTQDLSRVAIHVFKPVRKADFSGNEFTGLFPYLSAHA
ncbi:hypothetical protein PVAP13_8NG348342 [Panicum virgatum]|uniref:Uncharacterized protein n=1 Tax=Panicum virgatum TaxID=38727 RepID=A0A8T0PDX3_PANVG|nr:hypothetical protein PVAP13_8NG348342 [Panicum virgatum]